MTGRRIENLKRKKGCDARDEYVVDEYRRFELSKEFVRIEHDEDLIG